MSPQQQSGDFLTQECFLIQELPVHSPLVLKDPGELESFLEIALGMMKGKRQRKKNLKKNNAT